MFKFKSLLCLLLLPLSVNANPIINAPVSSGASFNNQLFYKPPQRGFATRRISASTRSQCQAVASLKSGFKLQVLAPAHHAGGTQSASPVLYWWLSQAVQANFRVTVSRVPDNPLVETQLIILDKLFPLQAKAGIQQLALANFATQLLPNVAYDWSISLLCQPEMPSANITSIGSIFYQTGHAATLNLAAQKGLWYDAIHTLTQLGHAATAKAHHWQHQRDALLRQEGLNAVANSLHPMNE